MNFKIFFYQNQQFALFYYFINYSFFKIFSFLNFFSDLKNLTWKRIFFFKKKNYKLPLNFIIKKNNLLFSYFKNHLSCDYGNMVFIKNTIIRKKTLKSLFNFKKLDTHPQIYKFYYAPIYEYFNDNKFFLLGGLISPYSWELENKKKWFKALMTEEFDYKQYETNSFSENELMPYMYKNVYFNYYNYFKILHLKYVDFKYYLKISNLKIKISHENTQFIVKPYSYLNITNVPTSPFNPYILFYQFFFKQYQKCNNFFVKFFKFSESTVLLQNDFFLFFESTLSDNNKKRLYFYEWGLIIESRPKLNLHSKNSNTLHNVQYLFKKIKKSNYFTLKNIKNNDISIMETLFIHSRFLRTVFDFFLENLIDSSLNNEMSDYDYFNFILASTTATTVKNITTYFFTSRNFNHFLITHCVNKLHYFFKFRGKFNISFNEQSSLIFFFNKEFHFSNLKTFFFQNHYETSKLFEHGKVFEIYKLPFISSKHDINLILDMSGFLYTSYTYYNKYVSDFWSYNLKKKYFSFSLKNELQKFIIRKYIKNSSAYYTLNQEFFRRFSRNTDYSNITDIYNFQMFKFNSVLSHVSSFFNNFLSLKAYNWECSIEEMEDTESGNHSFFIKKIRFKPGYMTFWRESRTVFKEILNLNFKYQHELTKYLIKFNKILKFNLFLNTEMSLENILLRSRFFFDWNTSNFFLANGLIYVNGSNTYNGKLQLYAGDFIQMAIHNKYYILYRWFLHWIHKKKIKLKIKTRKKLTPSLSDEDKTRTKVYPRWILSNRNILDDSPKFLELDFLTLSIFVIYEPLTWQDLNIYSSIWTRYAIINMYNWKYIT